MLIFDISEIEAIEQQKKEKEASLSAAAAATPTTTVTSYTPDYAAGLIAPATPVSSYFLRCTFFINKYT